MSQLAQRLTLEARQSQPVQYVAVEFRHLPASEGITRVHRQHRGFPAPYFHAQTAWTAPTRYAIAGVPIGYALLSVPVYVRKRRSLKRSLAQ